MIGLEDVAKLANVSAATASRALSRPTMVAEGTRERVLQAAKSLGYQPNQLARSLRQRTSRTIGLIITDILNPFHATLAKGVQDAAEKHDYTMFLFNTDEEPEKERRAVTALRGHLPQGLIVVPTPRTSDNLAGLGGLPIIEIDRTSGTPGVHTVMVNNKDGAKHAVKHLIGLGHRRIGIISGRLDITTALERHQGYQEALAEAELPYDQTLVQSGNHREEGGRHAAIKLLQNPATRPSALFVGNNEMTVGAVIAARELGLRIPQDLSIVGFDDTRWAQTMNPPLTVVSQPTYDLGYIACETLLGLLRREPTNQPTNIVLSTHFIERQSCAPYTPKDNA